MALFRASCPVEPHERDWIERMIHWCEAEFGAPALRKTPLLPTPEFFPGLGTDSLTDVEIVVRVVREHLEIAPERISVEVFDDSSPQLPKTAGSRKGAAGHYHREGGVGIIAIGRSQTRDSMALVATVAHELAHERLLGENHPAADEADHEPLTDLATVFFGLGIFTANSSFTYKQDSWSWRTRRLGYITEPMFGYALAYYAWLRDETAPPWARHLDTNPRSYFRQGLRYLSARSRWDRS